jgi:predicted NUDIX family phosphoesterase
LTEILCLPKKEWQDIFVGSDCISYENIKNSSKIQGYFLERNSVEEDENWLQVISYVIIRDKDNKIWSYQRIGGDKRLVNRKSCGIGGHVEVIDEKEGFDFSRICLNGAQRELREEIVNVNTTKLIPKYWLFENQSKIGRVHVGLVFLAEWLGKDEPVTREGESIESIGFLQNELIVSDESFELWSRMVVEKIFLDS